MNNEKTIYKPIYIRLSKSGTSCPYTGMTRTKMWQVLQEGKVKTICLAKKGSTKGCRLVNYRSLIDYLDSKAEFLSNPQNGDL